MSRRLLNQNSLLSRLLLRILGITVITIVTTYIVVYSTIDRSLEVLRNQTVEEQAQAIKSSLRPGKSVNKLVLDLSRDLRRFYANADYDYQYVVRDADGTILFRSSFSYPERFPKRFPALNDSRFTFTGPNGLEFSGVSVLYPLEGKIFYVQAAQTTRAADRFSDEISNEIMSRLIWVGAPFYCALLLITWITMRRGFRPLQRAAREVEKMNVAHPDFQIPERELPDEIKPFIKTINFSFQRLARSIREQKELTENLAHELRTPLSVLKANIEMLGRTPQSAKIARDVDAMTKLVNQMLDMTRLEYADMIEMRPVNLAAVLAQVCQDLWPLFLKDHRELRLSDMSEPVMIRGEPDLIYRAIRNVMDNAREHSPARMPVDVGIAGRAIIVRDYGPVIPEERRAQIFQRLHRLSDRAAKKSGAGLGLSIVTRTMEVHGGSVRVEPANDGNGNVFILDFNVIDHEKILSST
ncbi:MAG TPA: HAMP domain-containing sensor histidine kinase [Patescibacteria group bacterium]|nr:HAMP domain-containing sensor histidine kinase [Patescibacteria group bacterium]